MNKHLEVKISYPELIEAPLKINNSVEIAKSRSVMAKLLPGTLLHRRVEKAIAKKLQEELAQEGVDAVVVISNN